MNNPLRSMMKKAIQFAVSDNALREAVQAEVDVRVKDEVAKSSRALIYDIPEGSDGKKEKDLEQPSDFEILFNVYETVSWVRAVVDVITRATVAKGFSFEPLSDTSDPANLKTLIDFFNNPNPQDTFSELLEDAVRDQLVVGNGYLEKALDGEQKIVELWSLDPTLMTIKIDDHGRITGYSLGVPHSGKEVEFKADEVLHFKMPTKGSHPYGMSPLMALDRSIQLDLFARKYNKAFFKRGAKVRGIITMKNATTEQIERNRKYLENMAQKPELSRGDLLFEGDIDYKEIGTKPKDMEFLKMMEFTRDEILAVYGCPPAKVSLIETGNIGAGSGDTQDQTFYEETIVPLQTKIADRVNKQLIQTTMGIEDWRFVFPKRIMRLKETAQINEIYLKNEVLTINEVRKELGFAPRAIETKDNSGDDAKTKAISSDEDIVGGGPVILALENKFEKDLVNYFDLVQKQVVNGLQTLRNKSLDDRSALKRFNLERHTITKTYKWFAFNIPKVPSGKIIFKELAEIEAALSKLDQQDLLQILQQNLMLSADAGIEASNKEFSRILPTAKNFIVSPALLADIAATSAELAGYVFGEMEKGIKIELLEGLQKGEELPMLTARVQKVMEKPVPVWVNPVSDGEGNILRAGHWREMDPKVRAKLIARTETNRMYNAALIDGAEQSGVVTGLEFVVADTACPECTPYDGQIFSIADAKGFLPIHHNDRCTWAPVVNPDAVAALVA